MSATPATLIAHDLKNALAALEDKLAMLADQPDAKLARQAHERCSILRREFVQFLMVYGSEGTLRAHSEDESPQQLLETVKQLALERYQRADKQVRIALSAPPDDAAYWYLDARLVKLALDAAIHNAFRFATSEITLSVQRRESYLVLCVEDDGPGLGTADAHPSSTGLGTDLCRQVAQAHVSGERVGRIELTSGARGGARFELWLP